MRVLVLYAHPVEESFGAALHRAVVDTLRGNGHVVDDCDLYAEGFDPVLSREERLGYHSVPDNIAPVADHVERVRRADAVILVHPVWNFGFPAILKGYFDRVFLPEVSFKIRDGRVSGALENIHTLMSVCTYGADRIRAFVLGDPPRKIVTRMFRNTISPKGRVKYLALYDMNRSTDQKRAAFLARVTAEVARL